ncbi:MAG: trimeric intracellular cation channel family protein [Oscillospiraceae bacterium]|nr:trimeric intracellular cation channel family protein [Oscillospiraceae bacterium]
METFLLILELVGCVSFAVSGAMTGIRKGMDVFGVCIMGVTVACGGGVIRDLLLGSVPPTMFRDPTYALTAVVTALILFWPAVQKRLAMAENVYRLVMLVADAIGLGVFTAVGVDAAMDSGHGDNLFFAVFLGVITGVGGGILRDLLASETPYVFTKHIYACASLLGALLCATLRSVTGEGWALTVCTVTVIAVRLLAAHFRWSLPRAKIE